MAVQCALCLAAFSRSATSVMCDAYCAACTETLLGQEAQTTVASKPVDVRPFCEKGVEAEAR